MVFVVLIFLGLCFGSFVNAFVWRLHEGKDWINGRSECPNCHHLLAPKDLVPVLSWVWLRGKCRYCHKHIPDSPITELVVPLVFVLSYISWEKPLHGIAIVQFTLWLLFVVSLAALALYDLRWFILPDRVIFPLMGLAVVLVACAGGQSRTWHGIFGALIGMGIISGLFYALFKVSKGEWIGFGDVKLGVILGLIAGGALQACLLLFFASFLGVIISLPLVISGKANRKTQLPFGPLLIIGLVIVQLYGTSIINAYSRFFGV